MTQIAAQSAPGIVQAKPAWFVTGTDTEVGKTFAACALLRWLQRQGLRAVGMKPVAAGCDADGVNEDVTRLITASAPLDAQASADINPYLFQAAIAPHIAAREAGRCIEIEPIIAAFKRLQQRSEVDALIVEGVGGFKVPLNDRSDTSDLAVALNLPLILVVGLRLGCLNHALLTQDAIAACGLTLCGWVANQIDPQMQQAEANLESLQSRIKAPLLGFIPHVAEAQASVPEIDFKLL
ncbi:MAG: dethiobiotin synthase [Pseudomonadota bacterium]